MRKLKTRKLKGKIQKNHKSVEETTVKCHGSDVVVFELNVTVKNTKKEEKKRKRSNCVRLKESVIKRNRLNQNKKMG